MLTTTACPSCAVPLTIPSHAKGRMISCINCGHKFKLDAAAEIAHPVTEIDGSSQRDWQDQPSWDQQAVMRSWEEWGQGSDVSEFDDLDHLLWSGIKENVDRDRKRGRKRTNLAVLGVFFGLVSLACLWAWLLTHLLPWIYGCGVSWYAGAHLSLFGKGPIKIVGLVLNLAVMASCIVSAILFKGLIRIKLGW